MALNIGNKVYRNLQEQVGYNSEQIDKIFSILDGIDYEDHVVVIENISTPLTEDEMAIVNEPVAFLVYQDKLYFKDSTDASNLYFSAVIDISGTNIITIKNYQISVDLSNGNMQANENDFETYSSDELDNIVSNIETQISNMVNGSPKGVYATLSDLETAYPTGAEGIYIVQADGKWYYWNGVAWTSGGTYQATELSDYQQQILRLSIVNNKILNDGNDYYALPFTRGTIAGSGTFYSSAINFRSTGYIYNNESYQKQYRISIPAGCQLVRWEYNVPQTTGSGATNATTYNDTDTVMVINVSKYAYFVLKHSDGSTQVTEQELNSLLIYNDNVNDVFNYNKEDKNIIERQDSELSLRLFKNYNLQFKRGTIAGGSEYHSLTNFISTPRLHITETHMVTMKADDSVTAVFYRATTPTGSYAGAQSLTNGSTIVLMPNFYYTVVLTNGSTLTVDDLFKISFIEFYNEKFETLYQSNEETLIDAINSELDGNKIIFGLITDMHYGQSIYYDNVIHQIDIINNISNKVGASFNINLGDAYMNSDDTSANFEMLSEVMKRNKSSFVPWLYCKGNHENFVISGGGLALEDSQIKALTNRFNKWIGKTPINSLYYYYDINDCRFIVLDSSSNTNNGFSNEQITFLTDALADLGDKKAVVFTHIPPSSQLTSTGDPVNASSIRSILESNASSIIAVFYGHVHFDNYTEINGVKYIGTCCALPVKATIPAGISGNPTVYDRDPLNYTQYCFDFVIIDTDTKDIAMKRFGVGNNRQYSGS